MGNHREFETSDSEKDANMVHRDHKCLIVLGLAHCPRMERCVPFLGDPRPGEWSGVMQLLPFRVDMV
eukprot:1158510-Pelagomonas_calceolata.AAC.1